MRHATPSTTGKAMRSMAAALALLGVLQALPPAWHEALRFDRQALLRGELWRLWTGHLVHLGWAHAALNAAGLVVCALLADRPPTARTLLRCFALLGAGISVLFLALQPQLAYYVGLSGVLYGLFVLVLWPGVRRADPIGIAALCAIAAWLGWQLLRGPARAEEALIGGDIIVQAHVYGVACAIAMLAAASVRKAWPAR